MTVQARDLIQRERPLITGALAVYPHTERLEREFTQITRFGDRYNMWMPLRDGMIGIPRAVCPIGFQDMRTDGEPKEFHVNFKPRNEEQHRIVSEATARVKQGRSFIIRAGTGFGGGKCYGQGTPILMFDGSIKPVEQVQVGELLMGPDSDQRQVLATSSGVSQLFRVIPVKGMTWICNGAHVLSLRATATDGAIKKGEIRNIALCEWQEWSKSRKHLFKLWRTGIFTEEKQLFVEPYFLGILLGDGSLFGGQIGVTTPDYEIRKELERQADKFQVELRCDDSGGRCPTYFFTRDRRVAWGTNPVMAALDRLGVTVPPKHVPFRYKTGSRTQRLEILAGLIDTDGYHVQGCYDYISQSRALSEDIAYIARSVGLAAYVTACRKQCVNNGVWGDYWRVCISGDTSMVPCRVPRRQAVPRKQKKNVLNTGFSVEPIGEGRFYGFELESDGLHLLGDFTVSRSGD